MLNEAEDGEPVQNKELERASSLNFLRYIDPNPRQDASLTHGARARARASESPKGEQPSDLKVRGHFALLAHLRMHVP